MDDEIDFLKKTQAWILVNPPLDHQVINNRSITNKNNDGSVQRFKTKFVACCFQTNCWSWLSRNVPVARFDSIRTILSITASNKIIYTNLTCFSLKNSTRLSTCSNQRDTRMELTVFASWIVVYMVKTDIKIFIVLHRYWRSIVSPAQIIAYLKMEIIETDWFSIQQSISMMD